MSRWARAAVPTPMQVWIRGSLAIPAVLASACMGVIDDAGVSAFQASGAAEARAGDDAAVLTPGAQGAPSAAEQTSSSFSSADAALADASLPGAPSPSDAGAPAVSAPGDASPPVHVQPPSGSVPVITFLGDGAFSITSCDGGRSFRVNPEFSSERADHSPWTAFGGLAFGAGTFVAALGWGAPGHVLTTGDGVAWAELPASAFARSGGGSGLGESVGGVVYTGNEFLLFGYGAYRSNDGKRWSAEPRALPEAAQQLRQARAFSGLIVLAVENQNSGTRALGNYVLVSEDGGRSYREGSGFRDSCALYIQHGGDIALAGDTLLVGVGDVCRSTDRGATWEFVPSPTGGAIAHLFSDGAAFYALSGDRLWRSADGRSFEVQAILPGSGGWGAYVGGSVVVAADDASHVWQSDDGRAFRDVTPAGISGRQDLRDVMVGYGAPSAECAH